MAVYKNIAAFIVQDTDEDDSVYLWVFINSKYPKKVRLGDSFHDICKYFFNKLGSKFFY